METARELSELLEIEPIPAVPKLIVDDATAEAVENHLASQGGRLVVAGCEGGLFDVMAGRYSSGVGNLDVYLKGHAGDDLRVDRVIRGSMVVERCCLTLAYAVQPDVIRGLAERPSFRGRGLIGRFFYAIPESPLGRRRIDTEPVPSAVSAAYAELVRRLAAVPNYDPPGRMVLAPDAALRFRAWQAEVEAMLADGGRFEGMRDWGGKLCGATARVAAIMHLIGNERPEPWRDPVGAEPMAAATEIARWAMPHAESVIRLMAASDGPLDDARYVLRWLRASGRAEVTRRDVHVHGRARFDGEPERLDAALGLLVERGWLRPLETQKPSGPGRQPSPRFATHPVLRDDGTRPDRRQDEPPPDDTPGRERGTL